MATLEPLLSFATNCRARELEFKKGRRDLAKIAFEKVLHAQNQNSATRARL
jgi:hypothetical protein